MTNEEIIASKVAINKFIYFSLNFPHDFIEKIWGERKPFSLSEHLQGKFNNFYERYGSAGVMQVFYAELDGNNKRLMLDWILNNWDNEQHINFE